MKDIKYTKVGDYYYPNLKLEGSIIELSRFGRWVLKNIKSRNRPLYTTMLLDGSLYDYITDLDKEMLDEYERLVLSIAASRGIDEELKRTDQLRWVQEMNNARLTAEECIYREYMF